MRLILLSLAGIFSLSATCQATRKLFINQVITSQFVHREPLAIQLTLYDTADYQAELVEGAGHSIDMGVLIDLVKKSEVVDAKNWSDEELPNSFLIDDKKKEPPSSYFFRKYKPATAADSVKLRDIIEDYRLLLKVGGGYWYSRPIFDASGQYALVSLDFGYNLTGRGWTKIYHFSDGRWMELGAIKSWVH